LTTHFFIDNALSVLPKVGPMVLLESQLNEHRESQFHWIAGDPVGQIMVYEQQLWVAGTIADTLLQAFPSLDWTIRQEKTDTITQKTTLVHTSSYGDSGQRSLGESGQKSTREKNIWYSVLLDHIDLWSALNIAQKQSWWFGYLGYDLKNLIENLESGHTELYEAADLWFMEPGILAKVATSNQENKLNDEVEWLKGEQQWTELQERFAGRSSESQEFSIRPLEGLSKDLYLHTIESVKADIHEGDYYEMNFSHALKYTFEGPPVALYRAMREYGPVPFASYFNYDLPSGLGVQVCSASPERYLAKRGEHLWSEPIKGTLGRIKADEGERIQQELLGLKNKAEHLMIVDLVRNDLHRVALKGSVHVDPLFEVQSFRTVHQLVSKVHAQIAPNYSSFDAIRHSFPMGSMTGAPKIAAMQAIERYESYKRGIYSGAIGYLSPNDDFDFNVVIRTAIIQGDLLYYPVGGAITSDSDPELEWQETLLKAAALERVIR
jgi:para-aminobenzoate synthetase component 1